MGTGVRDQGAQALRLLTDALRHRGREEGRRAWQSLLLRPQEEVMAAFRVRWAETNEDERLLLLSGLATWGAPTACAFLAEVAVSPNPRLRREVARAIGRAQVRGTQGILVPLLDDTDLEVRAAAVWALGRSGAREAIPALIAATADEDTDVVAAAASALVALEARVPAPTVERLIRRGRRDVAVYGLNLVRFADPREVVTLRRAVEGRLRHPDSRVRSAAREALMWVSLVEKQHA